VGSRTLRFPRIAPRGIRDSSLGGTDKPWHDVMNTEAFAEQIRSTKDGCILLLISSLQFRNEELAAKN
jgi:hypothetical protein